MSMVSNTIHTYLNILRSLVAKYGLLSHSWEVSEIVQHSKRLELAVVHTPRHIFEVLWPPEKYFGQFFKHPTGQIVECGGFTVLTSGSQEAERADRWDRERMSPKKSWTKDPYWHVGPHLHPFIFDHLLSWTRWIQGCEGSVDNALPENQGSIGEPFPTFLTGKLHSWPSGTTGLIVEGSVHSGCLWFRWVSEAWILNFLPSDQTDWQT